MYQVRTSDFSGPLEKLLEFIETKKLDITTFSLAQVTGDFLSHIDSLKNEIKEAEHSEDETTKDNLLRMLADFLVVAAQLILIKSKSLLPQIQLSQEEEEGIYDLEKRLKIYSQLKPIFSLVKKTWTEAEPSYSRAMLSSIPTVFYPPKNVDVSKMRSALEKLLNTVGSLFLEKETIQRHLYSLEDKISEVSRKITEGISKFSEIISSKTKEEAIVLFLALLHLLRENTMTVSQSDLFGDISIQKSSQNI